MKPQLKKLHKTILKHKKKVAITLSLCVFAALCLLTYILWDLPSPEDLTNHPSPASTKLLDRQGNLLYEIYATERRTPISLASLPNSIKLATLAAEDKDFYSHSGFSIWGMARALFNTVFKGSLQGGSTITQQLVKKALLNDDRTPVRKIRELVLSLLVESRYSKDQIFEFYLNQIPYGGTAYGIESAAQTFFGKSASSLTLGESALLAGLPQAPSYYSPFGEDPARSQNRQIYVLDQMKANGFINKDEYESAKKENLNYSPVSSLAAPHFSLWVKDLLITKYQEDKVLNEGLVVTTSLDLSLHSFAQKTVSSEIEALIKARVTNGAALVTNPKTGEVLSMVGSKDYKDTAGGGNVNVTLRPRQPGSSIKPITYSLGIDQGLFTASTILADKPTCFSQSNQELYCPTNYDQQFHGPTQVRYALGNSFNIPAVKALTLLGLDNFVAKANSFGLTTFIDPKNYGPSITLGGGEVTMLDLATAYSALANSGKKVNLNPILQITDRNGNVLEKVASKEITIDQASQLPTRSYFKVGQEYFTVLPPQDTRVISAGSAFIISHLLLDNGSRQAVFGSRSLLNVSKHPEVSVKTGTTNDKRDNWTIGYNPEVLVSVWVGNNDNSPMGNVASGVTGASPIWNKVITQALANSPQNWPIQPPEVIGKNICNTTGLLITDPPNDDCPPRYEYFLKTALPPNHSTTRRDIPIYKPSQAPATSNQIQQDPGNIEYRSHTVIFDPLGTALCLDCPGGYGEADIIKLDRTGKAINL